MSAIATCPKCDALVNLPTGAPSSAIVRCPSCHAEYHLEEAIEHLLPQLEVVGDQLSLFAPTESDAARGDAGLDLSAEGMDRDASTGAAHAYGSSAAAHTDDTDLDTLELEEPFIPADEADDAMGAEVRAADTEAEIGAAEFEEVDFEAAETNAEQFESTEGAADELESPQFEPIEEVHAEDGDSTYASLTPPEPLEELGQETTDEALEFEPTDSGDDLAFDLENATDLREHSSENEPVSAAGDADETLDFEPFEPEPEAASHAETQDLSFEPARVPFVNVPDDNAEEIGLAEEESHAAAFAPTEAVPRHEPGIGPVDLLPGRKTRRRESSFVGTLLGTVSSGALGLAIAYVLILRFGGPDYDMFRLGPRLPTWLVGTAFESKPPVAFGTIPPPGTNGSPQMPAAGAGRDEGIAPLPRSAADGGESPTPTSPTATSPTPAAPPATGEFPPGETGQGPKPGPSEPPPDTKAAATQTSGSEPAQEDPFAQPDEPGLDAQPALVNPSQPAAAAPKGPRENVVRKPAAETEFQPAAELSIDAEVTAPAAQETMLGAAPMLRRAAAFPTSYPADELTKAVGEVRAAAQALRAAVDRTEVRQRALQFYSSLYRLASVLTFAKDMSPKQQAEVVAVLNQAAADNAKRDQVAKVGAQWIARGATKRGPFQGVVLTGRVESVERQGKLYKLQLDLAGNSPNVTVVTSTQPQVKPQDEVVVAGTIFEQPKTQLAGYESGEPVAVWAIVIMPAPAG